MYYRLRLMLTIALFTLLLISCGSSPEVVEEPEESEYVEQEFALEEEVMLEEPTPTVVPTPTVAAPTLTEGAAKEVYSTGEVARINSFLVRVNDIKTTQQTDYGAAKPGNTFVLVDITLENTSDERQEVSALLHMAVEDGSGQTYTVDVGAGTGFLAVNGPMEAGASETATLGYQVPENAAGLRWVFRTTEPDAAQIIKETGKTVFDIAY